MRRDYPICVSNVYPFSWGCVRLHQGSTFCYLALISCRTRLVAALSCDQVVWTLLRGCFCWVRWGASMSHPWSLWGSCPVRHRLGLWTNQRQSGRPVLQLLDLLFHRGPTDNMVCDRILSMFLLSILWTIHNWLMVFCTCRRLESSTQSYVQRTFANWHLATSASLGVSHAQRISYAPDPAAYRTLLYLDALSGESCLLVWTFSYGGVILPLCSYRIILLIHVSDLFRALEISSENLQSVLMANLH